jgi:hypothetical protein
MALEKSASLIGSSVREPGGRNSLVANLNRCKEGYGKGDFSP